MLEMVRHHLKRHKYKIVVGVPMVVLLASSLSFIRSPEEMYIVPDDSRFVEVDELVTLHVMADTDEPINVIGASITVPEDLLTIEEISREGSIIDLWSEEPAITGSSTISFSGGIVSPAGFLGNAIVLTLVVRPITEGSADITFSDVRILAHDGTGIEVTSENNPIALSIRPQQHPSPDVNGDSRVNIFDFGIVSTRLFMRYERSYDLNLDGKITIADIGIIISNITGTNSIGSLALWSI